MMNLRAVKKLVGTLDAKLTKNEEALVRKQRDLGEKQGGGGPGEKGEKARRRTP